MQLIQFFVMLMLFMLIKFKIIVVASTFQWNANNFKVEFTSNKIIKAMFTSWFNYDIFYFTLQKNLTYTMKDNFNTQIGIELH